MPPFYEDVRKDHHGADARLRHALLGALTTECLLVKTWEGKSPHEYKTTQPQEVTLARCVM